MFGNYGQWFVPVWLPCLPKFLCSTIKSIKPAYYNKVWVDGAVHVNNEVYLQLKDEAKVKDDIQMLDMNETMRCVTDALIFNTFSLIEQNFLTLHSHVK